MADEKDKADGEIKTETKADAKTETKTDTKEKVKKPKLTRVVFNKSYTPYKKGEMAGLEPEVADKLISDKVCSKA